MTRSGYCSMLVLALVGAGWGRLPAWRQAADGTDGGGGQAATLAPQVPGAAAAAATALLPEEPVAEPAPDRRTAFQLEVCGDAVKLLGTEELQGDFHRRRGRLAWWPGMLYFRLLDARQRVLAEETLAAPEPTCGALAAAAPGAAGQPPAGAMARVSAPVVVQVRMASVAAATELQVYRLSGPRPADMRAEIPAKLLATLTIQR